MCNSPHFTISIGMGRDILHQVLSAYGVSGWNSWLHDLRIHNLINGTQETSPLSLHFDCSGVNLTNQELDGIDLRGIDLDCALFCHSSLYGAYFATITYANFIGTDLRESHFDHCDLSGTIFTDAMVTDIKWADSFYNPEYPPLGLPTAVMNRLNKVTARNTEASDKPVAHENKEGMVLLAELIDLVSP